MYGLQLFHATGPSSTEVQTSLLLSVLTRHQPILKIFHNTLQFPPPAHALSFESPRMVSLYSLKVGMSAIYTRVRSSV